MKKNCFLIALICTFFFTNMAVSQTKRYVKTVASGSGNGSSWANASSNLQAMIDASVQNDEVWVAKGTFRPTVVVGYNASQVAYTDDRHKSFFLKPGVKLYGAFAGTEVTLGQRKLDINKTILSGDLLGNDVGFTNNSENSFHVVLAMQPATTPIIIDGFTITGGNTTGLPGTFLNNAPFFTEIPPDGAGVYSDGTDFSLINCTLTNNYSTRNGGAVCNFGFTNVSNLTNCLFINNRAVQGSVLHCGLGWHSQTNYVTGCTMVNNISNGATIYLEPSSNQCSIINSILWNNTATGIQTFSTSTTYSIVQHYFTNGGAAGNGMSQSDPLFTSLSDPDGADNILGTSDDGLIPQCGPAIGAGVNTSLPAKDIRNAIRIQHGTIDMGAYETSLIQAYTGPLTISELSNHATTENLPGRGYCEGKIAYFGSSTSGNGGAFQWKQNGVNVGTNSGTLAISNFHNGDQITLAVNSMAGCGPAGVITSNTITLANVSAGKPVITSSITGPTNACPYITGPSNGPAVAYKINKVPGAAVYHWYFSGVNTSGATIVSHPNGGGVNDTIVMVSFNSDFTAASGQRTLYVAAENWCGVSTAKKLAISVKIPQSAGTITGPKDPCPYMQSPGNPAGIAVTYSINKVLDASSYSWVVPANAIIDSHLGTSENDTAIVVIFNSSFVSGPLSVQAINFCGAKAPRTLSLSRKAAGTPGTITGPTSVCAFKQSPSNPSGTPVDYTIKKVLYATSYTWTLPANASATHPGGSGINDTIIRVTYGSGFSGGAITVKANTNCNTSSARSLTIMYMLPYTPGTVTASAPTACPQRRITYSLASLPNYATSVQWTVPASGTIISGQGTLSLVVEFAGPTTITDTIRVAGVNDCGTSASQRKLKVGILGACRAGKDNGTNVPAAVAKNNAPILNTGIEFNITVMPNPSQQRFTLHFTGADINTVISIQVTDITGRTLESKQNIRNNQTIIIGDNWKPGLYFATVVQGENKKTIRLMKL